MSHHPSSPRARAAAAPGALVGVLAAVAPLAAFGGVPVVATGAAAPPPASAARDAGLADVLALTGVTLYTGDGAERIADAVVVIRGDRIESAGSGAVPQGARTVDLSGRFVIPGLIDTHVHYSQTGWADGRPDARDLRADHPYPAAMAQNRRAPERYHRAFLACGVTTVFDAGGYPWTRDLGAATLHATDAPFVLAAGPLLSTLVPEPLTLPDQSQFVLMADEESIRAAVRSHRAFGSDAIKVWLVLREPERLPEFLAQLEIAAFAAAEQGLPLVVHATELEAARGAVQAGARLLVHSVEDRPVDDAFVDLMLDQETFYCPTLTVARGYLDLYAGRVPAAVEEQLGLVHPEVRAKILATRELGAAARFGAALIERMERRQAEQRTVMYRNLARLHAAGVPVVMGTDAGNPMTLHGPSVFAEMEAMQEAGLAPVDVLVAATRDAARAVGRGADRGLLKAGYVADLVVLDADPGEDIRHVREIAMVMRGGALRERAALLEEGAR